ncbi:Glutathione-dependent formaldehyde-activating enzyme [Aspergillus sclerotialis]|uniref:Glutathione-dependent formaldehyde-activating enzyme n=1 Tax=Aspergillus sclerotialis TaxID=2070753 RepID=A0A3A3ABK5_9EURO|nr:Glutathione-dependent formaldehyde-activating enzyme [Aspergillus sclerotialis]
MHTGSCLCKKVKYEYTGEPLHKATCHCLTCRKITGGTNTVNFLIAEDHFRIHAGVPQQHEVLHESGMKLTHFFCDTCGTPLYKVLDGEAFRGKIIIYAGSLDAPDGLNRVKPDEELYVKHRVDWVPVIGETRQTMAFGEF